MKRMAKYRTITLKLKSLDNSFIIANNNFSLCAIENPTASADDILQIFPYLLVKSEILNLQFHIKFIKLF